MLGCNIKQYLPSRENIFLLPKLMNVCNKLESQASLSILIKYLETATVSQCNLNNKTMLTQ